MNETGTQISLIFGLIDSNRRFIMLYLGCASASSVVYTVDGPLWGFALFILTHYLLCGLLGALKQDLDTGNTSSFGDFHKYGKRYFFKLFGSSLVVGAIVAVCAITVLAIVLLVLYLIPLLLPPGHFTQLVSGEPADQLKGGVFWPWIPIISFVFVIAAFVWSLGANSLIVYHDRGILEAVRGSSTVLAGNKLIVLGFVATMIIVRGIVFVATMRGISLNYALAVVALQSVMLSAALVFVYTAIFMSLKERTLSHA